MCLKSYDNQNPLNAQCAPAGLQGSHLVIHVHLLLVDDLRLELCQQVQQRLPVPGLADEGVLGRGLSGKEGETTDAIGLSATTRCFLFDVRNNSYRN